MRAERARAASDAHRPSPPARGPSAAHRLSAPAAASARRREEAVTRWAFYLYVCWIPLEYPDRTLPFDLGTLLGAAFVGTTIFSLRACYARPSAPVACYGLFLCMWMTSHVVNGGRYPELVFDSFLRLLLLVLGLWASSNLLRDPRTARTTLLVFATSCTALALLQVTGVADAQGELVDGIRRATVLGQNPNRTGRFLSGAALVVLAFAFTGRRAGTRWRAVALAVVALFGVALVQGGSRGAMLTLAAGVLTFAVTAGAPRTRVRNTVLAALVLGGMGWAALQTPLMQKRLALAESGNLAGREEIFPLAFGMFRERPLIGWGPIRTYYELASRLSDEEHERRDTHNLVLELLTTTGLAGAVPAFMAFGLCALAAWRARHGMFGALPLAMMAQLFVGNMSGNFLSFKLYWLFQALAIAAAPAAARPRARLAAVTRAPALSGATEVS